MQSPISRDEVVSSSEQLPVFPRVVTQILAALENSDAGLNTLAGYIEHDPVITGRVLSLANRAGTHKRVSSPVSDVFTAISLIGLAQVRQTALMASLVDFLGGMATSPYFWEHSVVVGVGCVELAASSIQPVNRDMALIAGLLHDVGQLWLSRFHGAIYQQVGSDCQSHGLMIDAAEHLHFGVDHAQVGAWLAAHWGLSEGIVDAITQHHAPHAELHDPLVAVVHVAEVLSHALDITAGKDNRVSTVSATACQSLGLEWGDDSRRLFGRIEARSRYAVDFLR